MAAPKKTPGVYVSESSAFPNSVVEVPTCVPAFVGYTELAQIGNTPTRQKPARIRSLQEFHHLFGGPPPEQFSHFAGQDGRPEFKTVAARFYLYYAVRLFFDNGGGACWIQSIGDFSSAVRCVDDYGDDTWGPLSKETEPSIYVAPDAVGADWAGYKTVTERMMQECQTLQDRVALLDLYDGGGGDLSAAILRFRSDIDLGDKPSFGVLYAPWLNTTVIEDADVTYMNLDADSRITLAERVRTTLTEAMGNPLPDGLVTVIDAITTDPADAATQRQNDTMLRRVSPTYQMWMRALLDAANVLPPAGAMAGVYAYTDATLGVFRAPANTAVASVMSPTVPITDHDQNNMNTPLNGKAVNAIRSFKDRGVLVWGARTLDGNSQDYRYISVRRTLIMLEQSMQAAIQGFVYSPNNVGTWTMLKNLLDSFLKDQWNAGALSGAVAEEAYSVSVGLGSTMTPDDIPERDMRIDVQVALSSPAEFFTITFQQKMQVA